MAAEQISNSHSKLAKHKLKFLSGGDNKDLSKHHDVTSHTPCCSLKSSVCGLPSNESNRSLCSKTKLKNNSPFIEKQESKCCVLKQRKSELPKKQVIKKEIENTPVGPPPSNNEELSKAKKRRLRKKKVLAIYTGSKVEQTPPKLNLIKPEPIVKPNPLPVSKEIKTEIPKIVAKELRKRSEKTILEARKKKINTKSPPQDSQIIPRKVTLVEPEPCYIKVNHDSSKVVEPTLPRFYFPINNQSASSNGRSNIGSNSVFYFGETKNELEGLSAFKSITPLNNTYDTPKKDNIFYNFSSVKVNSEGIGLNKFQQEETGFVNPAKVFAVNQSQDEKDYDFVNPSRPFVVNQSQMHNSIHHTKFNFVNSNIITNSVKQVVPPSVSIVPEHFNQKTMESGDLAQPNKGGKSREEVLAEREAKKAAKLAAKSKHKTNITELVKDKPSNVQTNVIKDNHPSNVDQKIITKRTTAVDGAVIIPKTKLNTDSDARLERSVDCVDGEIKGDMYNIRQTFTSSAPDPLNIPHVVEKVKKLILTSITDEKDRQENTEIFIDVSKNDSAVVAQTIDVNQIKVIKEDKLPVIRKENTESGKSKAELRAERRAKQEAQRAAKTSAKQEPVKKTPQVEEIKPKVEVEKKVVSSVAKPPAHHKAKLFSHLYQAKKSNLALYQTLNTGDIHPAIIRLGSQYASRVVNGSNARCIALLHALKQMICDYKTPTEKEFSRGLEAQLTPVTDYLNHCRPLSVSMTNALRHIKWHLTQLPNDVPDVKAQKKLCDIVDTYIREQIDVAGEAICNTVQKKIANNDVILTYGCSSLIYRILVESHRSGTKFRVIIVDAGPWLEGREMLRRLVDKGLECSYVLISATSFIMREVSKVLLGAHALLANGYVMSRAGSSQVALLAHAFNVPVLVCCETHKFSERVQTDAFVYNELGDPEEFVPKEKWANYSNLTPLTLAYDVTPPELVTAVVTELAILPCTSVPVILRIKPSESHM